MRHDQAYALGRNRGYDEARHAHTVTGLDLDMLFPGHVPAGIDPAWFTDGFDNGVVAYIEAVIDPAADARED
jgi:hypothetical protein